MNGIDPGSAKNSLRDMLFLIEGRSILEVAGTVTLTW